MKEKYYSLITAIGCFVHEMGISDVKEGVRFLKRVIEKKYLYYDNIIKEYNDAMADLNTDWYKIVKEARMFWDYDLTLFSNAEFKIYVRALLEHFLFPNKVKTKFDIELLNIEIGQILKPYTDNGGWMKTHDFFEILKTKKGLEMIDMLDVYYFGTENNIIIRDYDDTEFINVFVKYHKF